MKARSCLPLFLLLALALLFAQQGAVIHALSHLGEPLSSQSRQEKQLPHSPSCDKCVAYAGIGGAVAASEPLFALAVMNTVDVEARLIFHCFRPFLSSRSRAPPTPV